MILGKNDYSFINFSGKRGKVIIGAKDATQVLAEEFKKNGGDPDKVLFVFTGRPFAFDLVKDKETLFKAFVEEDGKVKLFKM